VIEEIVGDIQDEYDQEPPLYYQIDDKTWSVDAKIDLHDLNDALHFELPTEGEYESLGGFILSITGHIPEERELVKFNNYLFTIERVVRNRIIRVKVTQNPQSFSEEEQSRDEESNGEK
jgi:CBS domain containing-hemolysin-like protein